jgi:hypothetical protein
VLGLPGARQARYRFNRLEALGHLRTIEPARFGARVIELTASGRRTAVPGAGSRIVHAEAQSRSRGAEEE